MHSVMSYPNRGPWGKSSYRGNCSGYVIKDLVEHYIGKGNQGIFVDACMGSGTSKDVIEKEFPEIGYLGLDLRDGFDFTLHSIKQAIQNMFGNDADICFSHPPYGSMIKYSGNMWGSANNRDTSRCISDEEFLEKSRIMLLNQREATREGGVYCTLIGDRRQKGEFVSYQADFISMMPRNELRSVTIKMQHNCVSNGRKYANMKHPAIMHEYLLIWERIRQSLMQVCWEKACENKRRMGGTWMGYVRMAIMELGGKANLESIYREVEKVAGQKKASNPTWKATVRRTLQQHFKNVERGIWSLA